MFLDTHEGGSVSLAREDFANMTSDELHCHLELRGFLVQGNEPRIALQETAEQDFDNEYTAW
jgi:hypothetical protein